MTDRADLRLIQVFHKLSWAGALLVAALSCAVLIGWLYGIPSFTSAGSGFAAMSVATALGFVIAASSLSLRIAGMPGRIAPAAARALAAIVVLAGCYALASYFFPAGLGFENGGGYLFGPSFGRVAPATAISFILLGSALALGDEPGTGRLYSGSLTANLCLSALDLTGYAYGIHSLYALAPFSAMSLRTAASFVILSVAALLARPTSGWIAYVLAQDRGGMFARRLFPAVVVVPFILGWLMVKGEEISAFDSPFGFAIVSVSGAFVLGFVVAIVASWLSRTDAVLARSHAALHAEIEGRKQTEKQLVQAQKMEAIGNLTGGMAHDFNNLLGVVVGNLDLVRDRVEAEVRELVEEALGASLRGAELTRRLLAFARRQPLQPQPIDVNELVTGMVKLFGRTLGERIEISLELSPDVWTIVADPAQLEASLANLANNARDAMPDGGRLMIATLNSNLDPDYAAAHSELIPGDYALIEVSDTGAGMAPEVMSRIFEPFFTTKETGEGTGLGLSMVFGFLKQSGGHINVYSEVGVGTTFRLYLPRASAGVAARPAAPAPVKLGKGELVLAVEDNVALRRVVVRQLRDLGYRVLEAGSAANAIKTLETENIDLVFTDIVMAGEFDGLELASRVAERWPDVKVVLTSGFPQTKLDGRLSAISARLLNKPYRRADLALLLRETLDA